MNRERIIQRLNIFYGLELFQVDVYSTQSKWVNDIHMKKAFERMALIEQGHVDNLASKIRDMGGEPSKVVEVTTPSAGLLIGKALSLTDLATVLRLNIAFEREAISMYEDLIIQSGGDEELFDLLWANLIDEELHTAWFLSKLKEIESGIN